MLERTRVEELINQICLSKALNVRRFHDLSPFRPIGHVGKMAKKRGEPVLISKLRLKYVFHISKFHVVIEIS